MGGVCPECWRDISFLAGPSCRCCAAPLEADFGKNALCEVCIQDPPAWDRGAAGVEYEGVGRKLVLALKHGDRLDIAPLAAGWMARAAGDLVSEATLIAPAPLHWLRLARRRFNQSGELARSLADLSNASEVLALDLLQRRRPTESQDGKTRAERRANVADVFRLNPKWARRVRGARVLLVDDVLTTGATLSECARVCRAAGAAEVNMVVMARVAQGGAPA